MRVSIIDLVIIFLYFSIFFGYGENAEWKRYNFNRQIFIYFYITLFFSFTIFLFAILFYLTKHTSNSGILRLINRKILGRSSNASLLSYDDTGVELVRLIIVVDTKIPSSIIVREERKLITFIWNTWSKHLQMITSRQNIYYGQYKPDFYH